MNETTKHILTAVLALTLLLTPVLGEDTAPLSDDEDAGEEENLTEAELEEVRQLDEVSNEDDTEPVVGETYQEADLKSFSASSPALYTCKLLAKTSLFSERDTKSKKVAYYVNSMKAEVLYVGCVWVVLRVGSDIGFVKRQRLSDIEPVDPKTTPTFGTQKHTYIATTAVTCHVRKSMSNQDSSWVVLNPGTMLSIWQIRDGWAIVPYWRSYGYINMNELTDLIPVSETDQPYSGVTPIAAYTSYYKMTQDAINRSRIINISVGCQRLTRVMQPGDRLNFNKDVGPYRASTGYQKAWVLINGVSVPGYGGGTCQVSSTLYNALLQLPGIQILQRRPHGPGGASYLPIHQDAAVGNDNLNLRFVNNYDFPIRVEGHSSGDGALLMVVYRVDE